MTFKIPSRPHNSVILYLLVFILHKKPTRGILQIVPGVIQI